MAKGNIACPKCGSTNTVSRGKQIECKEGKGHRFITVEQDPKGEDSVVMSVNGETAEVSAVTGKEIKNERDAIIACGIDETVWEVKRFQVSITNAYRKDRQVDWDVVDGKVESGRVRDKGKLLVKPLYNVKIWLFRKTQQIRTARTIDEAMLDMRKASLKIKPIKYKKSKDGLLMEFDFPDVHFGKLAWHEETGNDYDVKIADKMVMTAMSRLLSYSSGHSIESILFPVGNDFFHSDTPQGTTFKGTVLDEDTRWAKTFRLGRQLLVRMIDQLYQVAPVKILIIPGNHDRTRSFYVGDSIESYYNNNKNVTVDNLARINKYHIYGNTLIGFNHGEVKMEKLSNIMPYEVPHLWAKSKYREWHLGHLHTTKRYQMNVGEDVGIVYRTIRSLSGADSWHYDNGYIGNRRAAEAYLFHPEQGNIANFIASGD